MRNTFISVLTELAEADERIVLLTGDLGYKIFDDFQKAVAYILSSHS